MVRSLVILPLLVFFAAAPAQAATVTLACGSTGIEFSLCKEGAETWAKETGNAVAFVSTPSNSSERLALYQQLLAAGDRSIDVFQIDVIWPGILQRHFIDLAPYFPPRLLQQHFHSIIENNTVGGRLVAMPWFTDAGVLYYRKDLLAKYRRKPPETWEDLAVSAWIVQEGERAAGNEKFWGFVWQGRNYEGLTCNALEWVAGYGGGVIVEADGRISINNPRAKQAVEMAASWIGNISPKGVLNYGEEEARGVFQSGNAAFMRNWPYAWQLMQSGDSAVKGKIGVAILPAGGAEGAHAATLGGWQLAVSKYSPHPDAAASLVRYLTSAKEQKRRAIKGSFNPTLTALYKDEDVLAAVPFFGALYDAFLHAVARPSTVTGGKYNQVSSGFYNAVHATLSGAAPAEESFGGLERRLQRISRQGRW